jgi:hypothetical protein
VPSNPPQQPPRPPRITAERYQLKFKMEDRQLVAIKAYAKQLADASGVVKPNLNAAIRDLLDRGLAEVGKGAYDPRYSGYREACLAQRAEAAKQYLTALHGLNASPAETQRPTPPRTPRRKGRELRAR